MKTSRERLAKLTMSISPGIQRSSNLSLPQVCIVFEESESCNRDFIKFCVHYLFYTYVTGFTMTALNKSRKITLNSLLLDSVF